MRARRRFGQHFLRPGWIGRVIESAGFAPADRVVEIGPGRGALTVPLANRVAELVAVEIDRDLAADLRSQLPDRVRVIQGDFLEVSAEALFGDARSGRWRVIGNLPYNVSSPILFRLLEVARSTGRLVDATLMLQREVAERIASPPGTREYGTLSILVQLEADVDALLALPPAAFRPAPRVQSTVVRLRFRPPRVEVGDRRQFAVLLRSMFSLRRKMLGNALQPAAAARGWDAIAVLRAAGVEATRRPETLDLDELARIATALGAAGSPGVV
jgi:16S rRNA (adenine1518-N6/adenine1519-N6)-dimethyltransferase